MPSVLSLSAPHRSPNAGRLLVLTLLVVLVHALALTGLPWTLRQFAERAQAPAGALVTTPFVTRTVTPAPVAPKATSLPKPEQRPAAKRALTTAAALPAQQTPVDDSPLMAQDSIAEATPATTTLSSDPASTPDSSTASATPAVQAAVAAVGTSSAALPASPAEAPADVQALAPVEPAAPARMLYDGVGEEKGFIKYAGSGELLWLPDGAQYSARLEISAWGFRVRTWTSKGALDRGGLAPLRFGDKPRGAELATHFQRDKGIISFSANNPDVPLRQGAQDKLSAILQLSALVAGAPERYGAGSSIRFQAADAHRAEQWAFQVGATEALELPGGLLQGLKLVKAPTAEFDQGIEVWLAPAMQYLPVRLRITEASGAFVDLLWRKTQKPEGG